MVENLDKLVEAAQQGIEAADNIDALEQIRVQYLGKKGEITALMKGLGKLSAEERPKAGQVINKAKQMAAIMLTPVFVVMYKRAPSPMGLLRDMG